MPRPSSAARRRSKCEAIDRLAASGADAAALALLPLEVLLGEPGTVPAHRTLAPLGWAGQDLRGVPWLVRAGGAGAPPALLAP